MNSSRFLSEMLCSGVECPDGDELWSTLEVESTTISEGFVSKSGTLLSCLSCSRVLIHTVEMSGETFPWCLCPHVSSYTVKISDEWVSVFMVEENLAYPGV